LLLHGYKPGRESFAASCFIAVPRVLQIDLFRRRNVYTGGAGGTGLKKGNSTLPLPPTPRLRRAGKLGANCRNTTI